jgi:hypothetical protein
VHALCARHGLAVRTYDEARDAARAGTTPGTTPSPATPAEPGQLALGL